MKLLILLTLCVSVFCKTIIIDEYVDENGNVYEYETIKEDRSYPYSYYPYSHSRRQYDPVGPIEPVGSIGIVLILLIFFFVCIVGCFVPVIPGPQFDPHLRFVRRRVIHITDH